MKTGLFRAMPATEDVANLHRKRKFPTYRQMWLKALLLHIVTIVWLPVVDAGALPEYDRVRILPVAAHISDAELTDQHGQSFQLSSLHGRVALFFFGFTSCPDVCPTAMAKMRELYNAGTLDPKAVAFIMISVDGERDTASVMKTYLQAFSPDFIGLTGEPTQVKAIAKNFSAAFFKEGASVENGDYLVSHSPQIFVVDQKGRLRAECYDASTEAMAGLVAALQNEANSLPWKGNE